MKNFLLYVGLISLLFISCKKDLNNEGFRGIYIEVSPVPGRSQLNFISNNLVIKSETGSVYKDTFLYLFTAEKIILTPTWTNQYPSQQFDFKKIDEASFQVESLYPSIPEETESFMTFKK